MNTTKTLFLFFMIVTPLYALSAIHIVCTAALLNAQAEIRQQEYIHSLSIIRQLGYEPYVIEACKQKGPTFLNGYSNYVFYSTANNQNLKNKGINEAKTMLQGLKTFNFEPDDMIIKITGRYYFTSNYLLQLIDKHQEIDAIFKSIDSNTQVFTGCFAMRYKHLITMLESFNYEVMESRMINLELECAHYIKRMQQQAKIKVIYTNKLDVQGKAFGPGNIDMSQVQLLTW